MSIDKIVSGQSPTGSDAGNPLSDFVRGMAVDRPLAEVLAEILREKIVQGELLPGARLVEAELSKLYGVSRGPVREALRCLDREGLLETEKHRSPTVKGMDLRTFGQMFEVRSILESYASLLAARNVHLSATDLRWAKEQAIAWREESFARDVATHIRENRALHQRLLQIAGHSLLTSQVNSLIMPGYRAILESRLSAETLRTSALQHAALLEAIVEGDEREAERLMRGHVEASGRAVVQAFSAEFFDPQLAELRRLTASMDRFGSSARSLTGSTPGAVPGAGEAVPLNGGR